MRIRLRPLSALLLFALCSPRAAIAWPFISTDPDQPATYVGTAGYNYTVRLLGSVWTVDTDGDGTIDGYFAAGDSATASASWVTSGGMGPLATYSAFDINASAGDPLPAEKPDVPDAEPNWNSLYGTAGAQWAFELSQGAGKHALAALYGDSTGANPGASNTPADQTTIEWALAQWPFVPGAAGSRVAVPLSGTNANAALAVNDSGTRLEITGTLTEGDGNWNIDTDTGTPGDEQVFALAQAAIYFQGTFTPDGATITIPDPTGMGSDWTLQEWKGRALLHPGPVKSVCASGCDYTTVYGAVDAATNGMLIRIAAGNYAPKPGASKTSHGYYLNNKHHVTIVGSGLGCNETVLDAYDKDTGLYINLGYQNIVMNLTAERGFRRSAMAYKGDRTEFSDVCVRGYGKLVGSKTAHGTTYFGPYGITAFEATNVHYIRLLSEDNATGAADVVRSSGVVITDSTLRSTGFTRDWGCLYLATLSPSTGAGANAEVKLRGQNTIDDCYVGIHLEDESRLGVPQEAKLIFEGDLTITNADATFRRRGLGTVSPSTTDLAHMYDSCWSLRNVAFDAGGAAGELHFREFSKAMEYAAFLSSGNRAYTGPHFDSTCLNLKYASNYSLSFAGSLWTVDADNDGLGDDGVFVVGNRDGAAAGWNPGLSLRAFDIPSPGGDPKPNSTPDIPEADAAWGSDYAEDGSRYGIELAIGAGKTALGIVNGQIGGGTAVPLDPNPAVAEWAIAQWPYVDNPALGREAVPLTGTIDAFAPVFTDQGALDRLDVAGQLVDTDALWTLDQATAIAGYEESIPLSSGNLYFRGSYQETGNVIEIPNPIDSNLPPWRLNEWQGEATVHLGPVLEVCHPSTTPSTWPALNCTHTTVQSAVAAATNGTLVSLSPGTFAETGATGNQVGLISGKDRISIQGAGTGCGETIVNAPAGKGYVFYVSNSTNVSIRNLTARYAALHHAGASYSTNVEFHTLCGYGQGPTASNGQSYPGPTGFNFNHVTGGVMNNILSADNASNGIAVQASTDIHLRDLTIQNSGGSQGWAGLALYTGAGPSVAGGNTSVTIEGTNSISDVPMGIFLEDNINMSTFQGYTLEAHHLGATTIANYSVAPIFRLGLGTVTPSSDAFAQSMDMCWRLDEIDVGLPTDVSQAYYGSRPEVLAAEQGAALAGFGSPVVAYNPECDCNAQGPICEDGNPCVAQMCGVSDGQCTYASRPLGDIAGNSNVSVGDALCAILLALTFANPSQPGPLPACLTADLDDADCNCDGDLDLEDAILVISRAVSLPLDPGTIDQDQNQCPDTCETYAP